MDSVVTTFLTALRGCCCSFSGFTVFYCVSVVLLFVLNLVYCLRGLVVYCVVCTTFKSAVEVNSNWVLVHISVLGMFFNDCSP